MSTNFSFVTSKKKFIVDADENADEFVSKKFRIDVNFELLSNDLIYYVEDNIHRLCIFNSIKIKIYHLIYDVKHVLMFIVFLIKYQTRLIYRDYLKKYVVT